MSTGIEVLKSQKVLFFYFFTIVDFSHNDGKNCMLPY